MWSMRDKHSSFSYMIVIVGLGNPGIKYEKTRHNVGFMVLDQLLKDLEPVSKTIWEDDKKCKADTVMIKDTTRQKDQAIILAKPKTYMNNSGMAVACLASYYKIAPEDIWVVHDELDSPLGHMKIRLGGASAGHHGVDSVMAVLGTDKFWRFRMGIGQHHNHDEMAKHEFKNAEDYVLGNFVGKDRSTLKHLIKRGSQALQVALEKGMLSAQNQFNTK
jgi:PTH1 family peptidyl-tRNA hydrolase